MPQFVQAGLWGLLGGSALLARQLDGMNEWRVRVVARALQERLQN